MAFTQLDANHHTLAVDVGRAQMHSLTDTHPGTVHGAEDDMVSKGRSSLQQLQDFLRAQDSRQSMILFGSGNELHGPIALQSDAVEEPQRADRHDSRSHRCLPLVCQVDLVCANLFGTQLVRRFAEMSGEETDLVQIALLRIGRKVAHRHVFDHPLAQRRHLADGRNGISKRRCFVAHGEQP